MSFNFDGSRIKSLQFEPIISVPNIAKPSAISGPIEGALYLDATQKAFGKMIGGVGGFGHEVVNVNVAPVTGPSNTTTETSMMSYAFPTGPAWVGENTGSLNAVNKTILVYGSGLINNVTAAAIDTFKIRLGGATGAPPTGTVVATFTPTISTIGLTNAVWTLWCYITIQAANASGGTGVVEAHGQLSFPLAAAAGVVSSWNDANTSTVTVGDLTTSQLLLISATMSVGGASNNVSQRQMVVEVLS